MNQKELIVANENNVFITLYGINFKSNNKDTYIYSFKTIIIGAKGYNYLNNITSAKIKIMFQNSKGIFNPHTHKTINIPNTCKVNLNNNHILFSNCNLSYWDLNKTINNIANFLYFITGKDLIIKEFEYTNSQTLVTEKCDEKRYYKFDVIHDNFLVNINDINNLTDIYINYINLLEKVKELPIQAFFIAKDNTSIIELKLVFLLQALDGLCQNLYNSNISLKYTKSELDLIKKIIKNDLKDILDKNLLDAILQKIGLISGIDFKEYINYITSDTTFGKIIFNKEITKVDNCEKYYDINTFKSKSIDERNRFSHMNNTKKNYIDSEEAGYFYLKYKLTFRCCILTSIGLTIKDNVLINSTELIANVFPNISNKCFSCQIENKTCNH